MDLAPFLRHRRLRTELRYTCRALESALALFGDCHEVVRWEPVTKPTSWRLEYAGTGG